MNARKRWQLPKKWATNERQFHGKMTQMQEKFQANEKKTA